MTFSEIKELLEMFESGSIREMDLKKDDVSLYLNKNEMNRQGVQESTSNNGPKETPTQPTPVVFPINTSEEEVAENLSHSLEGATVDSPIVGVIYTASEPSAPNFVSVGDKVNVGDTLCIIEAMKIMNEVKSDISGTITEILIENEDVVEFSQPLFRIV
ncbi:MAG: acetyl-CoA carboxylase biotin carboxyl carrier protein [Vagococcus sp.]|uniref:acetyl-CoA carboxylase biotin carboxyl carrier protein n=1 Tax=Vagococcus sp. TaxID=1933889 RepID=UPI002FCA763F